MPYSVVDRASIDEERWNQCVEKSDYFRHYGLTQYLDAACDNWYGLVGDNYSWVWPIPTKGGIIKRIHQPLLCQQLGPYGAWEGEISIDGVLGSLSKEFRSINIKFNESVKQLKVESIENRNVELSLHRSYDEIKKSFNRNVISNLKKADREGLTIEQTQEYQHWLIEQFKEQRGSQLNDLDSRFYSQVQSIYESFTEQGAASTYIAVNRGERVAGLMILRAKDRLLLFFSHSTQKGRKIGAMHALLANVIKESNPEYKVLDFEGSNDEKLAFFYKSFGGEEKVYLQAQVSTIPWPLNRIVN